MHFRLYQQSGSGGMEQSLRRVALNGSALDKVRGAQDFAAMSPSVSVWVRNACSSLYHPDLRLVLVYMTDSDDASSALGISALTMMTAGSSKHAVATITSQTLPPGFCRGTGGHMGAYAGAFGRQGRGGHRVGEPDRHQRLSTVRVRHASCPAHDGDGFT